MDEKFLEIFDLYKNDIYRLSYSYTKELSISEDITQVSFMKLYKNKEMISKPKLEIKKWLVVVTINQCKTYLLSYWKNKVFYLSRQDEKYYSYKENDNEVITAILKLPKKYRIPIFLYYYEGYKIKEIAAILKVSTTCLQTRIDRARKRLKELLMESD